MKASNLQFFVNLALTLSIVTLLGCGGGPARVKAPAWSPASMAQDTVQQLDASGDAEIDRKEAAQAPGLLDAFDVLDTDHNGTLSASEIKTRFDLYVKLKTAFVKTTLVIKLNNRPLRGVFVKLIPEEFQGDSLLSAIGTTDGNGQVSPRTEGQSLPAMQPGFYRVVLYKDDSESEPISVKKDLGVESSPVSRVDRSMQIVLDYKSKR